jgi:quercetin dioxygenase-like cupin family protein
LTDSQERRATDEEMERVKRCWRLPQIELGPGAMAYLFGSERMSVSFITQAPNITFKTHSHDNEEIVIVLDGERDEIVDGVLYRIKSGDIMVVPPGAVHGSHTYEQGCKVIEIFAPPRQDLLARLGTPGEAG